MNRHSANYHTILIIICIFFTNVYTCYGQRLLDGVIKDSLDNEISDAIITIKANTNNTKVLAYTLSDSLGYYSIRIPLELNNFILEFSLLSYKRKHIVIYNFQNKNTPTAYNVILKNDPTQLEAVTVSTKTPPINTKKKDTTEYVVEAFKDGNERVVEDLLKKLPGIEVKTDGKITFKGKRVTNVLLNGDNLFDGNYTIGTKNIDIDIVEKVSAIENYIENSLLHGLKKSNDAALNLILKEGRTDFSKAATLGIGIENRLDLKATLLGISKKIKSFSIGSFNNIGIEDSPYNFLSNKSYNERDFKKKEIKTLQKIIEQGNFISPIESVPAAQNNNLFGSANWLFKTSNKLSIKTNLDYKKDKLEKAISSQIIYDPSLQIEDYNQLETLNKKPSVLNFKAELKHKLSEHKLLEINLEAFNESVDLNNNILLNNNHQSLQTTSNYSKISQLTTYTQRINSKTAFVSNLGFNFQELKQDLKVSPDWRIDKPSEINNSYQSLSSKSNSIYFSNLMLHIRKKLTIEVELTNSYNNQHLVSNLDIDQNTHVNNLDYRTFSTGIQLYANYSFKKWILSSKLKVNYLGQDLKDYSQNEEQSISTLQFLPYANITYRINKKSNISLNGFYDEALLDLKHTFSNLIFSSNTTSLYNTIKLNTLKKFKASLAYQYYDFFNLTNFNTSLDYRLNKNDLLSKLALDNTFLSINFSLVDLSTDSYSFNIGTDNYINLIKSNLRFNWNYSINEYNNFINQSELRKNISYNSFYEVNIKTGFLGIINFENTLSYNNSIFSTENLASRYRNNTITNTFKTYVKPIKRMFITGEFNYYIPDFKSQNPYHNMNLSIRYTSKNEKIDYTLISNNINTSSNVFNQVNISDYSTSTTSYKLLNPFVLLSVNFKF